MGKGKNMNESTQQPEIKTVGDQLIAGLRYKGKYEQCAEYFPKLCRKTGWLISGKPFSLYYDADYKEDDADVEVCVPIRKEQDIEGINVRMLPGGRCVSLIHIGPYEELKHTYCRMHDYIVENSLAVKGPAREIYLKGPGMIFRGNPQKYRTEIQFMLDE
ncbi:MAG: AraC family transcriptional regulator [bacterium]|nr:AraC family transcriptional regulator [bacterium]